jgi:hypothetical protein
MSDEKKPPAEAEEAPSTVPSFRLREETEKRQKAEEQTAAIVRQYADLEAKFSTLEKTHSTTTRTHGQDLALISAGVTDPEVRDFVRSRFKPDEEDADFGEWLSGQREKPSALLKPFLGKTTKEEPPLAVEAPAEEAETAEPSAQAATPAGNPNAGAGQPAGHNGKSWGAEEITAARGKARGRGLGSSKDAILAQLRAEGAIQ